MLRAAVEREFITIGEAIARLRDSTPDLTAKIRHSRRIVDFRNILVHAYTHIDDTVVWDIVQVDLPKIRDDIEGLLD